MKLKLVLSIDNEMNKYIHVCYFRKIKPVMNILKAFFSCHLHNFPLIYLEAWIF